MSRVNGHSVLIPLDEKWNPLEHVSAPVLSRVSGMGLIAACDWSKPSKLFLNSGTAGAALPSGYWAAYPMEWIDIVAKEHEYLNDPGQAREAAQQWARTRHRVTPEEVSRMEAALSWPARYLCSGRWFAG